MQAQSKRASRRHKKTRALPRGTLIRANWCVRSGPQIRGPGLQREEGEEEDDGGLDGFQGKDLN